MVRAPPIASPRRAGFSSMANRRRASSPAVRRDRCASSRARVAARRCSAYPHLGQSAIAPMLAQAADARLHRVARGRDPRQHDGQHRDDSRRDREANIVPALAEAEMMFRLVGDVDPLRAQIDQWAAGRAELEYGSYIPAQHFLTRFQGSRSRRWHIHRTFLSSENGGRRCCSARDRFTWRTRPTNSSMSKSCAHRSRPMSVSSRTSSAHDRDPGIGRRAPARQASLGATGAVLASRSFDCSPTTRGSSWVEVAASERSVGKRYADAARWIGGDRNAGVDRCR